MTTSLTTHSTIRTLVATFQEAEANTRKITIYCHTAPHGKRYVGQSRHGMDARWRAHVSAANGGSRLPIHRAITKYGAAAFVHAVLEVAHGLDAANACEALWIERLGSRVPGGYNLNAGGGAINTHPETRRKLGALSRAANARRTQEERRAISAKLAASLTWQQRSDASKRASATMGPELRQAAARKGAATMTAEQRSERSRKANAALTLEERSRRSKRMMAARTPEQRSESAKKTAAAQTPEARRAKGLRAAATLGAVGLSIRNKKSQAFYGPAERSEIARKRMAARTPESRGDALRKAWLIRRNKPGPTPPPFLPPTVDPRAAGDFRQLPLLAWIVYRDGRVCAGDIVRETGIDTGRALVLLSLLFRNGCVIRHARGEYGPVPGLTTGAGAIGRQPTLSVAGHARRLGVRGQVLAERLRAAGVIGPKAARGSGKTRLTNAAVDDALVAGGMRLRPRAAA